MTVITFQIRRDTAANWVSNNPTLAQGEIGLDLTANRFKLGTGSTAWASLAYAPNTVFTGSGAPSSALGVQGDIYFDTTATAFYGPKGASTWPSGTSLVGPAGPTGPSGPTNITALTGDVTASGSGSVAATLATVNSNVGSFGNSLTVPTVTVNAKGLVTAASQTAIPAATTAAAGLMSAADKNTVTNLWYDVTNYGVSISNTGAANVAALNTLIQTTAPGSARFWFPATAANYPMTGTVTVTQNSQRFIGAGALESVLFCGNTTVNLFQINDGVSGVEFHELGFWTTATATAGAAISAGTVTGVGNQQTSVINCGFNPFGGSWFNCVVFNGSRGGEVSLIDGCQFNAFTNWGVAVVGNTSTPGTTSQLVINQTNMNGQITGTTGAVAGVYVQQSGAVNITDCSIILCNHNMMVSPLTSVAQVVASIYGENTFFDSAFGDCVTFTGVGAIVRCKFTGCSFTLAAAAPNGSAAFSSLNTAANAPAGIDFENCSFANTFGNANTTFGLNLTNIADVQLINAKVSGWTTGIAVTPSTPAGSTRVQIIGGVNGPAGGIKGNGTGILLNAGATTYGLVQIQGVSFPPASAFGAANTTNLTDNSTILAGSGAKVINGNTGGIVSVPPASVAAVVLPVTTVTNVDPRGGLSIPIGVRPGTHVRCTVLATNAATIQTLTVNLKLGTANTNADATILAPNTSAGTAVLGSGKFVIDMIFLSATTGIAFYQFMNGNPGAATGIVNQIQLYFCASAPFTIATTAQQFLGVYFASTVASIVTVRSASWEVVSS